MRDVDNYKKHNWYVYRHIRLDKNIPFYIGIGNKDDYARAKESNLSKRNVHWNRIVNKTKWRFEILFQGLTKKKASDKEKEFIALYGRKDNGTGVLCNMTNGGDGIWGCKMSDETKLKLRLDKLGRKNPAFGKKQSDEMKRKRALALKKSWSRKTESERRAISEKKRISIVKKQGKPVIAYEYDTGNYIDVFDSISRACRELGIKNIAHASMVCSGKRNRVLSYVLIPYRSQKAIKNRIVISKKRKPRSKESRDKMAIISSKPVIQLSYKGKFIKEWNNIKSASEYLKTTSSHISSVCKGKRISAGGFKWKYKK